MVGSQNWLWNWARLELLKPGCPIYLSLKKQALRLSAYLSTMPASAQHMMSQKPPKNVDLRCALAQKPDHRLAYTLVLCTGLQAVECSNGGGEQHPITALRLLKQPLRPVSALAPSLR